VGDEFRAAVIADVLRAWAEAGELLQHGHCVLGFTAPTDTDRQAEPTVLFYHFEELYSPRIDGGVELEVHGPHLVRVLGLVTPLLAISGPGTFLLARSRALEFLLPSEPVHPLVVH